jgi:hypothetical protein
MASAPQQAADQSETAIHTASVAALTALSKLAAALKQAGVDQETVNHVDEMSNDVNAIASSAVGNPPADAAPAPQPPGQDLGGAIQDFHSQQVAAAGA